MAFKELASLDADTILSIGGVNKKTGKKNPTSIEGYYLGSRKVESKKGKDGFSTIHFFQTSKGNVGMWGKTDSDRKLANATAGAMTRVSFVGMQSTPNGDMYKFKVEVDLDNSIDVADLSAEDTGDNYSEVDSYEASDTEEAQGSDDDYEQVAVQAAQEERKNRVQNLLSKGKKA